MKLPAWKPFMLPQSDFYREVSIQGRKVRVSVSPYDIPEAYRIWVQKETLLLFIELKYIEQDSEMVVEHLPNDIACYVGKISHRLYKLECKIDPQILASQDIGALTERTKEIIDALGLASGGKIKKVNSELVQSGIASHATEIQEAR